MSGYMKPQYLAPSLLASVAISKGEAVKHDGSGGIDVCAAGARALGFADGDFAIGQPVAVAVNGGGAQGIAGGTIAAGASLKTDANGHLVATTTTDDIIVAIADESAVDNDVFAIRPIAPTKY